MEWYQRHGYITHWRLSCLFHTQVFRLSKYTIGKLYIIFLHQSSRYSYLCLWWSYIYTPTVHILSIFSTTWSFLDECLSWKVQTWRPVGPRIMTVTVGRDSVQGEQVSHVITCLIIQIFTSSLWARYTTPVCHAVFIKFCFEPIIYQIVSETCNVHETMM